MRLNVSYSLQKSFSKKDPPLAIHLSFHAGQQQLRNITKVSKRSLGTLGEQQTSTAQVEEGADRTTIRYASHKAGLHEEPLCHVKPEIYTGSTTASWGWECVGLYIEKGKKKRKNKEIIHTPNVDNLSLLCFFKTSVVVVFLLQHII